MNENEKSVNTVIETLLMDVIQRAIVKESSSIKFEIIINITKPKIK